MVFMFFNGEKSQKKSNISWHIKLCEIQTSVSINKIWLEYNHTYSFTRLLLSCHGWAEYLVTEAPWPTKAKVFTICPLTEKISQTPVYSIPRTRNHLRNQESLLFFEQMSFLIFLFCVFNHSCLTRKQEFSLQGFGLCDSNARILTQASWKYVMLNHVEKYGWASKIIHERT